MHTTEMLPREDLQGNVVQFKGLYFKGKIPVFLKLIFANGLVQLKLSTCLLSKEVILLSLSNHMYSGGLGQMDTLIKVT